MSNPPKNFLLKEYPALGDIPHFLYRIIMMSVVSRVSPFAFVVLC